MATSPQIETPDYIYLYLYLRIHVFRISNWNAAIKVALKSLNFQHCLAFAWALESTHNISEIHLPETALIHRAVEYSWLLIGKCTNIFVTYWFMCKAKRAHWIGRLIEHSSGPWSSLFVNTPRDSFCLFSPELHLHFDQGSSDLNTKASPPLVNEFQK